MVRAIVLYDFPHIIDIGPRGTFSYERWSPPAGHLPGGNRPVLGLGRVHQGRTFECFYHYLAFELSIRSDADKDIWILLGIGVNLAFRMGYHRDPSHFPFYCRNATPRMGNVATGGYTHLYPDGNAANDQ